MSERAECKGAPGPVAPVVDRNRCEGREDCARVCPYGVFAIQELPAADRSRLSFLGRLKAWAHGGRQAHVVAPADRHACQLCVAACPEQALRLAPIGAA